MYRILAAGLTLTLGLAACKVDRTPAEYYGQYDPAATERQGAEEELRARVELLARGMAQRDGGDILGALSPAPEAYLIGPGEAERGRGREEIVALLHRIAEDGDRPASLDEIRVTVSSRAGTGWFTAVLDPPGAERPRMRLTGVYLRQRGEWRFVQGHVSYPAAALTPLEGNPPPEDAPEPPAG